MFNIYTDMSDQHNFVHDTWHSPGYRGSGYWHWSPSADTKQDVDTRGGFAKIQERGTSTYQNYNVKQSLLKIIFVDKIKFFVLPQEVIHSLLLLFFFL